MKREEELKRRVRNYVFTIEAVLGTELELYLNREDKHVLSLVDGESMYLLFDDLEELSDFLQKMVYLHRTSTNIKYKLTH